MSNAKGICTGITIWCVIKVVINMLIGGGFDLVGLIVWAAIGLVLISGKVPFFNYITAVILGAIALYHLPGNLTGLPGSLVYLLEAAVDIVCVIILCTNKDVKDYFPKSF